MKAVDRRLWRRGAQASLAAPQHMIYLVAPDEVKFEGEVSEVDYVLGRFKAGRFYQGQGYGLQGRQQRPDYAPGEKDEYGRELGDTGAVAPHLRGKVSEKAVRSVMRRAVNQGACVDDRTGEINMTCLAEDAAAELNHDEWLDDPDHMVWEVALEVAEAAGGLRGLEGTGKTTFAQVKKLAREYGYEFYRGQGYYYWMPIDPNADIEEGSHYVYRVADTPLSVWEDMFKASSENRDYGMRGLEGANYDPTQLFRTKRDRRQALLAAFRSAGYRGDRERFNQLLAYAPGLVSAEAAHTVFKQGENTARFHEGLDGLGDSPGATTWSQIPRTAKVMLGARDAIVSEGGNTLSFKIGRNAKSINWIRIRLDPDDTYTMQFGRGLKSPRVVNQVDGVYYDQMLPVIEEYTGMRTGGIR